MASDKVLANPLFSDKLSCDLHWILIENHSTHNFKKKKGEKDTGEPERLCLIANANSNL